MAFMGQRSIHMGHALLLSKKDAIRVSEALLARVSAGLSWWHMLSCCGLCPVHIGAVSRVDA